jgi:hypothetical protein
LPRAFATPLAELALEPPEVSSLEETLDLLVRGAAPAQLRMD